MAEWKFVAKQEAKRKGSKQGNEVGAVDEIVVQRMSADVCGKQQKYTCIGAQEYVPFDHDELTIKNIKDACLTHFRQQLDNELICDVLAGERGPSCKKMAHIPNTKVFYVRFLKPELPEEIEEREQTQKPQVKRPRLVKIHSQPSPTKEPEQSRFYPKSLSIRDMLRLGHQLKKKTVSIQTYKFDLHHMEWATTVPAFTVGGFRKAYKVSSITEGFKDGTWVMKKYTARTKEVIIQDLCQTEIHARKSIQMHYLARNLASQLKDKIEKENLVDFGETFTFNKVLLGKMSTGEVVTLEEFIDGEFVKYINNTGDRCVKDNPIADKAEAFCHFTYEKSEGKLIVLDIQGSNYTLYDPEVASHDAVDENGNYQFCSGNLSVEAINGDFTHHKCNKFCKMLKLSLRPKESN